MWLPSTHLHATPGQASQRAYATRLLNIWSQTHVRGQQDSGVLIEKHAGEASDHKYHDWKPTNLPARSLAACADDSCGIDACLLNWLLFFFTAGFVDTTAHACCV